MEKCSKENCTDDAVITIADGAGSVTVCKIHAAEFITDVVIPWVHENNHKQFTFIRPTDPLLRFLLD